MESSIAKKVALIAWFVLSCLSMANSVPFHDCYGTCFVVCAVMPGVAFSDCPSRCMKSCTGPLPSLKGVNRVGINGQQQNQCKLGCATSLCTKFSTKENPAAKEVGSCVDYCSQTCFMH